jgi:orotate phosphoribosyltransferase
MSLIKPGLCVGLDFNASFEEYVKYIELVSADVYKVNPAFFNLKCIKEISLYFKENNIAWIYDAKFGDVTHTNQAYAEYVFEELDASAVTLNPFAGLDALEPFLSYKDKISFILCKTTNNQKNFLQESFQETLISFIKDRVNAGVVFAGNLSEELEVISKRLEKTNYILSPGIGAQGGAISKHFGNVIFSVSRSIRNSPSPKRTANLLQYKINNYYLLDRISDYIIEGDFTLSSGIKSKYYVDLKSLTKDVDLFEFITDLIASNVSADAILGIESGSISYATGAALKLRKPFGFVRKSKKHHGTGNLVEGISATEVTIIEDVLTTGKSLESAIKNAESCGFIVKEVIVIVNRNKNYNLKYNLKSLIYLD